MGVSSTVEVGAGRWLFRRGDAGGDLYLVLSGQMQVVDTRQRPATIIATMDPGDTIGEIAFVDATPRSADVRASVDSAVRHWSREDLDGLMEKDPALAADFYRSLSRIVARRLRRVTQQAVAGTMARKVPANQGARHADQDARALAERTKEALRVAEFELRASPGDAVVEARLREKLGTFEADLALLRENHPDNAVRTSLAGLLRAELQPWLMRASLSEKSQRKTKGGAGAPDVVAHVMVGEPTGDGVFGELLDAWLLERPTFKALRAMRDEVAAFVVRSVPRDAPFSVTIVGMGTGSVPVRVALALAGRTGVLTVVDASRDVLAYLDASELPPGVHYAPIREDVTNLEQARLRWVLPPQDVIVLNDLLPYFPDRLAVSALRACQPLVGPSGALVATSLMPSRDAALLDLILDWPAIRRSEAKTEPICEAAACPADFRPVAGTPGLLAVVGATLAPKGAPQ